MRRSNRQSKATEDARAILNRIRRLVHALRTFEKQAQARYGFGAAQMFILHVLRDEGTLSLNELAERTATDQSSVSLAVGKLVEEGYIHRTTSAKDRREVRLSLTPKARALVRRAPPAAQERIMSGVQLMSARDRARLTALLDQLLAGVAPTDFGRMGMLFQERERGTARKSPRPRRRS